MTPQAAQPTPKFQLGDHVAALVQGEVVHLVRREDGPRYTVAVPLPHRRPARLVFTEPQLSRVEG